MACKALFNYHSQEFPEADKANSVCINSIIVIIYGYDPNNIYGSTLDLVPRILIRCTNPTSGPSSTKCVLWTIVELGLALICACLPTYGPLLQSFLTKTGLKIPTKYPVDMSTNPSGLEKPRRAYLPTFKPQERTPETTYDSDTTHLWSAGRADWAGPRSIPLNAIAVEKSVEIV